MDNDKWQKIGYNFYNHTESKNISHGNERSKPMPPRVKGNDPYNDEPKTIHSETVGPDGPVLIQDTVLHETLENFVHEKTVERAVHVKGFGAFGHFQPFNSMKRYTRLKFLQNPGKSTPVAVRFSLAVSTKGTPDTSRNVRGFSTKFYTDEGIFDLLCNHIPVFLIRDALRFPESIKAFLPSPVNNLIDPERFWAFISRAPEATHFVTWLYSDLGTIKSLRKIRAYGVNTYVWVNDADERHYVKYHWIPLLGEEHIDKAESIKLAGENPDTCGQDLYDAIARGDDVKYDLYVQLMKPETADMLTYDPLDDTKVWDEEQFPLIPVGRMTLNQNPKNYTEEIEWLAYSPANLQDGAEFSNDKMLQGRTTIYYDAQRYRLGPDFRKIPINHQEKFTPDQLVTSGLGLQVDGKLQRTDVNRQDNFRQAGERYNSLSAKEKEHLIDNIASELYAVSDKTRNIVMSYFAQASQEMADKINDKMYYYSRK